MATEAQGIIVCENLVKIYKTRELEVVALQGLDLTVQKGEMMAIIGNSGSGKSTLLNMLGGLDTPSAGLVEVNGLNVAELSQSQLRRYKSATVGFVWQNTARNLIPYITALENVELPMQILGKVNRPYAKELLEYVGLAHRMDKKLFELSGGEQQRVAIAIALANRPGILLADEPTGAVDTKTTEMLLNLMQRVNEEMGVTVVIVTHDRQVSAYVNRVVAIRDGRTSSEFLRRRYDVELENLETSLDTSGDGPPETHEEFAVMDRAGRVQIPTAYMQEMGLKGKGRVKLTYEEGCVVLQAVPEQTPGEE